MSAFDFCLSTSTRFDNKNTSSCLASRRSVAGRGPMAQGKSPRNPVGNGTWNTNQMLFATLVPLLGRLIKNQAACPITGLYFNSSKGFSFEH